MKIWRYAVRLGPCGRACVKFLNGRDDGRW
jgi:hypothetical protein